jgi:hypothetical protein
VTGGGGEVAVVTGGGEGELGVTVGAVGVKVMSSTLVLFAVTSSVELAELYADVSVPAHVGSTVTV